MFERLNTPDEVLQFKLGAALKMENTVLQMLGDLQEKAHREELGALLRQHEVQTRQQITNLERAFERLGFEVEDSPCPAIEGIEKEGQANIKKSDDTLVDVVILAGAAETEHHEIAVYETLIIAAQAKGAGEVVALLSQNLEQEQHTLEEVSHLRDRVLRESAAMA